ncbi:MAG: hypothetical protein VX850_01725 [Gemmatimonadota bacterium]|nr:hypothetical protein [Gemmatimonadota bacterium]MEC9317211.1 hypothetical protein [Gemmatimonadota bacterium]
MPRKRSVRIRNWRLKLAALGLSVFLWALVQTEPRTSSESFQRVPVRVELTDTLWTLAGPPTPTEVELQLSGSSRDIIRLDREGTALNIPISQVGTPDTSVFLDRDWVELGQSTGLTVEFISPAMIEIVFEPTVTRTLPIATRVYGDLRENLALASSVGLAPVSVRVRGSESQVSQLDSIWLERFDLGTVEKSGVFSVAIDTVGLSGAYISPDVVTMGLNVEDDIERVLQGFSVQFDSERIGADVTIEPVVVEVRFSGPKSLVNTLDPSLLRVWVSPEDLEGILPGEERRVPLRLEGIPEFVTAVPETSSVTAKRADEGSTGADQALR